jgi:hypothetical protein
VARQHLVLAVSNVTLLPVLLPAAPFKTLPARIPEATGQMFQALRVDPQKIAAELSSMSECFVATTNDRRVLGTMNDFDRMLDCLRTIRAYTSLFGVQAAETACGRQPRADGLVYKPMSPFNPG